MLWGLHQECRSRAGPPQLWSIYLPRRLLNPSLVGLAGVLFSRVIGPSDVRAGPAPGYDRALRWCPCWESSDMMAFSMAYVRTWSGQDYHLLSAALLHAPGE